MTLPRLHRIVDDRASRLLHRHLWIRAGHPDRTTKFTFRDFAKLDVAAGRRLAGELAQFMRASIPSELHALHDDLTEVEVDELRAATLEFVNSDSSIMTAIVQIQTEERESTDEASPADRDAWRRLHSELNRRAKLRRDLDFTEASYFSLGQDLRAAVSAFLRDDPESIAAGARQIGMNQTEFKAVTARFFDDHPDIHRAVLDDYGDRMFNRFANHSANLKQRDTFPEDAMQSLKLEDAKQFLRALARIKSGEDDVSGPAAKHHLSESEFRRALDRFLDRHAMVKHYMQEYMPAQAVEKLPVDASATPETILHQFLWWRAEKGAKTAPFTNADFMGLDPHLQTRISAEMEQILHGHLSPHAAPNFAGIQMSALQAAAKELVAASEALAHFIQKKNGLNLTKLEDAVSAIIDGTATIRDLTEDMYEAIRDDETRDELCDFLQLNPAQVGRRAHELDSIRPDALKATVTRYLERRPWLRDEIRHNAAGRGFSMFLSRAGGLSPATEHFASVHFQALDPDGARNVVRALSQLQDSPAATQALSAKLDCSAADLADVVESLIERNEAIRSALPRPGASPRAKQDPSAGSPVLQAVEHFVDRHGMAGDRGSRVRADPPRRLGVRSTWRVEITETLFNQLIEPDKKEVLALKAAVQKHNYPHSGFYRRKPGLFDCWVPPHDHLLVAVAKPAPRGKFVKEQILEIVSVYGKRDRDGTRRLLLGKRIPECESPER